MESHIHLTEFYLANSIIESAGKGVFTKYNLPADIIIGKYEGRVFPSRTKLLPGEIDYAYDLDEGSRLVPHKSCIFRYMNDIVDLPESLRMRKRVDRNLLHNVRFVEEKEEVYIQTTIPILSGQELFINYSDGYWDFRIWKALQNN